MAGKSWRGSARWRGSTRMRYSLLSVGRSATSLLLYCSESLTSRDLFVGFTPDISDWKAPGDLKPCCTEPWPSRWTTPKSLPHDLPSCTCYPKRTSETYLSMEAAANEIF